MARALSISTSLPPLPLLFDGRVTIEWPSHDEGGAPRPFRETPAPQFPTANPLGVLDAEPRAPQVIFHEYAVNSARRRGVHSFWENRWAGDPSAAMRRMVAIIKVGLPFPRPGPRPQMIPSDPREAAPTARR